MSSDSSFEYIKSTNLPTLKFKRSQAPDRSSHTLSINSVYDAALIVDTSGMILVANARAEKRLGVPAGKLVGAHILTVIRNANEQLMAQIVSNVKDKQYTLMEGICGGADGRTFTAEIAVSPERVEPSGGICFLFRDISDRVAAEARLRTVDQAVRNAASGIAITDTEWKILFVNPAFTELLNGRAEKDILGARLNSLLAIGEEFMARAVEGAVSQEFEIQAPAGDSHAHVLVECAPNVDSRQNLAGFVVSCQDVTQRYEAEKASREAEEHRLQAEQAKQRLERLTALGYAVNNPLQALLGKAELDNRAEDKSLIQQVVGILNEYFRSEASSMNGGEAIPSPPLEDMIPQTPATPGTVLIVDDEQSIGEVFRRFITHAFPQATVNYAVSGRLGLESFSQQHHCVLVVDMNMPEMNGEALFHEVETLCRRKLWMMPHVIFCTGFMPPPSIRKLVADGQRHGLLPKPVSGAVLTKTVGAFLSAPATPPA